MNETAVKLAGINKVFHTRRQDIEALHDINIEIGKGEFVSIVGPSGCGKSTIIRLLVNIIAPTSGQIFVDGDEITKYKKYPPELLRKMGFVFQLPNLLPWMTVRENVALPLNVFNLKGEKWEKRVDELIELVGLTQYANSYPIELSGGMVQRIGVIRALVHDPEILLMDEPFGALDELTREQMDLDFLDIWRKSGKTIIFITHNVTEAVLVSQRIVLMATAPGRVTEVIDIDLPQPRTLEMINTTKFAQHIIDITKSIGKLDISKIK